MKWVNGAREGLVVAGGQGQGNDLSQLNNPRGLMIDSSITFYVADYGNNRVMRYRQVVASVLMVAGGKDSRGENRLNGPMNLSSIDMAAFMLLIA
jgi:hypothetical protein